MPPLPQSALSPSGPAAAEIERLLWWFVGWTVVPALLTIALLVWAWLRRPREGQRAGRVDAVVIMAGGVLVPTVVLAVLLVASVRAGHGLARPPREPRVTIDVIGHMFWWEIVYPGRGVITANELHIPVGEPVRLRLGSADVIHSLWVPRLHGKRDLIPGHLTQSWLQADAPGVYRGQCAEFCGEQHALMGLLVVAEPPEAFARWLEAQARPAGEPADAQAALGRDVFVRACSQCHVVRGVTRSSVPGGVGPDLTHLASRRTLAAATADNNRGNLSGFILNPHQIKPGLRMPPSSMSPSELHALLRFLEALP